MPATTKTSKKDSRPQVLVDILDTIVGLRDSNGSPAEKIMQRLRNGNKIPVKKGELYFKKAMRTGVKCGLIRELPGGKYKLGMDRRDYVVLKRFQQMDGKGKRHPKVREVRRKRGGSRERRRRGRSRRRRRHREENSEVHSEVPLELADRKPLPDSRKLRNGEDHFCEQCRRSNSRSNKGYNRQETRPRHAEGANNEVKVGGAANDSDLSYVASEHCLYGRGGPRSLSVHRSHHSNYPYDQNGYN